MPDEQIPLGAVIRELRAEIVDAATSPEQQTLRFELGPIEVEFHVVVKREGGPQGKIKFGIPGTGIGAEIGGGVRYANETVQKVKLTLTPFETDASGVRRSKNISRPVPR